MSTKNKFSELANLVADTICAKFPSVKRTFPRDEVVKSAQGFLDEWETAAICNAVAPATPGDVPPGEKTYPDKGNPAPVPVPSPDETESGSKSTKESTPEYDRFTSALASLTKSGKTLFEAESDDDGPESEAKRTARTRALDDVEAVRASVYSL